MKLNIQLFADVGKVIVGTEVDTSGIDKGLDAIYKKLEKLRKKAEEPYELEGGIQVTGGWNLSPEDQKYYDRLAASYEKLKAQKESILQEDTQIVQETQKIETETNKWVEGVQTLSNGTRIVKKDASELSSELSQVGKTDLSSINKQLSTIGKSIKSTAKSIVKWGLAFIGVRSAISLVRRSISTLSQYDDQLGADIEYIRYALASGLRPVIEYIISLVKRLMYYVGYILKAWFGIDIWANASAKGMQKTEKSAKKLQKTMAGFDEMNVLQDTSDTSSSGGGATPSFDMSAPEDIPIPSWLQWLADNGEIVIGILSGLAAGLLAVKFGLKGIQALGFGITIAGIVMLIQDIIDFIKDPSWQNFITILGDILIVIGGIMLMLTGNWLGLLIAAIGLLVKFVAENWDKIKEILKKVGTWIYDNVLKPIYDKFKWLFDIIKQIFSPIVDFFKKIFSTVWNNIKITIENIWKIFKFLFDKIKVIFKPIVDFFKDIWDKVKDGLKGFVTTVADLISKPLKAAFNGLMTILEDVLNVPIKAINGLIHVINKVPGVNLSKLSLFNLPRLAQGGIVSNPGPGVMMGSYIAGEKGPEAVIPLDDNTLDRLGIAFARHTVINANITNSMNGRVISKELQKISAENDFAYNR